MSRYTKTKFMKKLKYFFKNKNVKRWTGILALLTLSVGSLQMQDGSWFYSSVLNQPSYSFDGTVSPFEEMIDYTELSSSEKYMTYTELKAAGPENLMPHLLHLYEQENLTFDLENINWSDQSQLDKMNLQYNITVPYAGNYKIDSSGIGAGSHPGIDWVMPIGTPVRSAVVGEVTKVSEQSSGFGHHIVVKTENAPHPTNSDQLTTIYFVYSHLSDIYVNEGDIVQAGEVIALSGETGTATAAHLDWQLALEDVPWTPYWPFTWSEASAAGYSFWDAVNNGLGEGNVYTYMADPAEYVLKHNKENYVTPVIAEGESEEQEVEVIEIDSEVIEELLEEIQESEEIITEEPAIEEEPEVISVVTMDISNIDVDMPSFIMVDDRREIEITLYDVNGDVLTSPQFTDDIEVSLSNEEVAKLNRSFLDKDDFNNGVATLDVYGEIDGDTTIIFEVSGSTFTTTSLNIISEIQPFAKFGLAHDGYFVPGTTEIVQVQAQDLSGDPTPTVRGDGTVELEVIEGDAELSPSRIDVDDFKNGIYEVEVNSESMDDIVIKVTYGKKTTESRTLEAQDFTDLSVSHEYYPAVSFLRTKGTITGYPDGTFKPENDVSRIEALKMIFSGMDLPLVLGRTVDFSDTAGSGEWYSDYLATAANMGVVQGYSDGSFKPSQGVNRVEFLKMIFASMDISIDPVVIDDPAKDVDNLSWFAPYVQYAIEMNIFPETSTNKDFNPAQAMSRIEVAEVIYRLLVVIHNDEEPYSIQLDIPGN